MAKKKIKVPFDVDGNMLFSETCDSLGNYHYGRSATVSWRPNSTFKESIRFVEIKHITSGRSAYRFLDNMDKSVWLFEEEAEKIIPMMVLGRYDGEFAYRSRCGYFSLKVILSESES